MGVRESSPASPSSRDAMLPAATDLRGIDVLLVDDDDRVRPLLSQALRRAGFRVHEASGEDALSDLEVSPARLLLTDVVMPGMSGCELADRARRQRPGVRVVFMSGSCAIAATPEHGFLLKPFRLSTMLAEVRRVLSAA
jgi:two-component system cell cycle sensor histidine kinase/response regulator CckA